MHNIVFQMLQNAENEYWDMMELLTSPIIVGNTHAIFRIWTQELAATPNGKIVSSLRLPPPILQLQRFDGIMKSDSQFKLW